MLSRSLSRHMKNKHDTKPKEAVCVDKDLSIYLTRKTNKGEMFPCHVRKDFQADCQDQNSITCELSECTPLMNMGARSGIKAAECAHLARVTTLTVSLQEINTCIQNPLLENKLLELGPSEKVQG